MAESVTDMAVHRGSCDNCNTSLGKHDAVFMWYARNGGDGLLGESYSPRRGCLECFEEAANEEFGGRSSSIRGALRLLRGEEPHARSGFCARCNRPVIVVTLTKYPGEDYGRVAYCSRTCREFTPQRGNFCQACGKLFAGKRRGAKTCSPACRQKAYRERKLAEALGVVPAELLERETGGD